MTFDRRQKVLAVVKKAFPEFPCFFGFDYIPELKACIQSKTPFIFTDHAYFGRGYENGNFRVILNGIHQTKLKKYQTPRFKMKIPPLRSGREILVFPPSVTISQTFDTGTWVHDTVEELKKHTDRKIIVKKKNDGDLFEYLKTAHATIGYATVASVESAMCGVPALTNSPNDPCSPIGFRDFHWIHGFAQVDITPWVATLTYSQFHISEIANGFCREVLLGDELSDAHNRSAGLPASG